jgi:hypothetical protein
MFQIVTLRSSNHEVVIKDHDISSGLNGARLDFDCSGLGIAPLLDAHNTDRLSSHRELDRKDVLRTALRIS